MIYISASEMEERLTRARAELAQDDDYNTARVLSGFDTAVDAATCYHEDGDIWHTWPDEPPEGAVVLAAVCDHEERPLTVVIAEYKDNAYSLFESRAEINEDDVAIYAWADLPSLPEVP